MSYLDPYNIDGTLKYIPVNGVSGFRKIIFDMPSVPKESKPEPDPKSLDLDPDPEQIKIPLIEFSVS